MEVAGAGLRCDDRGAGGVTPPDLPRAPPLPGAVMSNTFGTLFRVTTFGESHGRGIGAVVDGCPPGIPLDFNELQTQMARRRPGQGPLTSARHEEDPLEILSGVFEGHTLGTPLALFIPNQDSRPGAYDSLRDRYRPSHADYTTDARYGIRDFRGGGRASARETAARMAAGAVAFQVLRSLWQVEIVAWVAQVEGIEAVVEQETVTREQVDSHPTRCPDPNAALLMEEAILRARSQGDTVGGVVEVVARNVPAGWGEPVFDKLHACLGHALLSLPACKGFEVGSGFAGTRMRGSVHNDPFRMKEGRVRTVTHHSGGIQGGISNGETLRMRAAFKPVSTHFQSQQTVTRQGEEVEFRAEGRHDPCVLPRAVPIVEAMVALVLLDQALLFRASRGEAR